MVCIAFIIRTFNILPFNPDRRTPGPLLVLLADADVVEVCVVLRLAVFHVVLDAPAALRHCSVEEDCLAEPSAHEV